MSLGFDSVHPGGMNENSPAFQRWDRGLVVSSPEGTAESTVRRTSLRDLCDWASIPSVETLGYFPPSLRDRNSVRSNPSGIGRDAGAPMKAEARRGLRALPKRYEAAVLRAAAASLAT